MERCNLRRPVQKIQAAISQMLDTMSLAELVADDVPALLAFKG
jgi:DNA-binding IscR family transcriptional regulator